MTDYGEYIVSMYCAQSGVKCEEIVRCRDCRFYEEEGFCNWFECSYCGECQRVEPDGFCAWGERRVDA